MSTQDQGQQQPSNCHGQACTVLLFGFPQKVLLTCHMLPLNCSALSYLEKGKHPQQPRLSQGWERDDELDSQASSCCRLGCD